MTHSFTSRSNKKLEVATMITLIVLSLGLSYAMQPTRAEVRNQSYHSKTTTQLGYEPASPGVVDVWITGPWKAGFQWHSNPDIKVGPTPIGFVYPRRGVPTKIWARVHNDGPDATTTGHPARAYFKVHYFTIGEPGGVYWITVGADAKPLDNTSPGNEVWFSVDWTPLWDGHVCIEVWARPDPYGPDTDPDVYDQFGYLNVEGCQTAPGGTVTVPVFMHHNRASTKTMTVQLAYTNVSGWAIEPSFPQSYSIPPNQNRTLFLSISPPESEPVGTIGVVEIRGYIDGEEAGGAGVVVRVVEAAVGGALVPVDKLGLLAPYIALASTIVAVTATTAIYAKRVKRRKDRR